jgi:hypothetical protein
MDLYDFPPYIESGLPFGLFGPAPRNPTLCGCGRYVVGNECPCADMSKAVWRRENPEAYNAEQAIEAHCKYVWKLWKAQCENHDAIWYPRSYLVRMAYYRFRDTQSAIGCYTCEERGSTYCSCECDVCGDKYCQSHKTSYETDEE